MKETPQSEPTRRRKLPGGLAVAAALVAGGGVLLRPPVGNAAQSEAQLSGGVSFWVAFVVGGALIGLVAVIINFFNRTARLVAILVVLTLIVLFAIALGDLNVETTGLLGYGFVAGGILVAVGVMFVDTIGRVD